MSKVFIGFRYALTIWVVVNMWLGHAWALYVAVTYCVLFSEMSGISLAHMVDAVVLIRERIAQLHELMDERDRWQKSEKK